MKLSLHLLHQRTPSCKGGSSKSLAIIKADLIKHHPDLNRQTSDQPKRNATDTYPDALKDLLLGECSNVSKCCGFLFRTLQPN